MELRKYFIVLVSLYCGECVGTDIDITAGRWKIGPDLVNELGGVRTLEGSQTGWPQDITDWEYWDGGKWHPDPTLTVTGNSNIETSVSILTIFSVEGPPPPYPELVNIKDETGENNDFAGGYRRQGDSRVWRYGDFELSFDGNFDFEKMILYISGLWYILILRSQLK